MNENICMICKEIFNTKENYPQVLFPCGHNLCNFCIVNLVNIYCPYCGQEIITFTKNRNLEGIINYYNKIIEMNKNQENEINIYKNNIDRLKEKITNLKLLNGRLSYKIFKLKLELKNKNINDDNKLSGYDINKSIRRINNIGYLDIIY